MKVVGLVTEYNPFHNGHLHHLDISKEKTKSDYSVAVMSGNFLQRGEPALLDKWTRAKMAVENGVDLVIELPTIYACQSAEYFAYGAVNILDSLGVIDSISFGSEAGDLEKLDMIASVLYDEPEEFKEMLKNSLDTGVPFPKARTSAIIQYMENFLDIDIDIIETIKSLMSNPNNILGIEYLKAIKKLNSSIIPYTIQRVGSHYSSKRLEGDISSATAIRKSIFENNKLSCISKTVPKATYDILKDSLNEFGSFNRLENYNDILIYLIRTMEKKKLKKLLDIDEGLENRIIKCGSKYNNITNILDCVKTKRYTYTRLQRILTHMLITLYEDEFLSLHKKGPQYIRILGFNKKGIEILSQAKQKSSLPIITKFANYRKSDNPYLHSMIEYDIKSTDIYFLGLKKYLEEKVNLDFYNSPFMKK